MLNSTDLAFYGLWFLLAFVNRQAFLMIACLFFYHVFYFSFAHNKESFICTALMFSLLSITEINIKSEIRQIFLAFSFVYWLSAVDEFLFYVLGLETGLRFYRPYIITILNGLIAAYLWANRRPNLNGNSCFFIANFNIFLRDNFMRKALHKRQKKA